MADERSSENSQGARPMKHQKQIQLSFAARVQVRDEYVQIHITVPKRWLVVLATIVGALLTSTPLAQLLDALSRLPH
jgi:hypothetical protein